LLLEFSLPYIISKEAIADLDEIWYYTVEKWSVEQATTPP